MKKVARSGVALMFGMALSATAIALPAGAATPQPTKPGAPTITAVKPGFHSVKVRFVKPADNGGAKIANYRVVCRSSDGGRKAARSGPASPIKVTKLNTGKTYTCTVAAQNKVGRGPASGPSDPFIPPPHN